ncbi:hypothetical protein GCM10025792_52020 [Pseudonocardia tropica]
MEDEPAVRRCPGLRLSIDALVDWPHAYGSTTRVLVRVRAQTDTSELRSAAVISELLDNPRGHYLLSDFAGAVNEIAASVLPASVPPQQLEWYAHHGSFSTVDPAGPESFTRVTLTWEEGSACPPSWEAMELLPHAETPAMNLRLALSPVQEVLRDRGWPTSGGPACTSPPSS